MNRVVFLEIMLAPESGEPFRQSIEIPMRVFDKLPKDEQGNFLYEGHARLWTWLTIKYDSQQEYEEQLKKSKERKNETI